MASKGPRSRIDHESRARRNKALEAPKEPRRPRTHWDHVIEEMVWLSKDFESERKWKIAQAKRVAIRASKSLLDHATKEERKIKEEEQRLKKVALNISKEIKKFWMKIEKLVLYKHQLELEERKKKALDKQLDFLLGQTERYSTMLAENLACKNLSEKNDTSIGHKSIVRIEDGSASDCVDVDKDYSIQSEDEHEDDERTLEEDEAFITKDERIEELTALQEEVNLPLEELLKRYTIDDGTSDYQENNKEDIIGEKMGMTKIEGSDALVPDDFGNEIDDMDYTVDEEEKDDEATLSEEEELALKERTDPNDEIRLLQRENEIPLEELLARYKKDIHSSDDDFDKESEYIFSTGDGCSNNNGVEISEAKGDTEMVIDDNLNEDGMKENIIADAAAAARSAQPTGNTFSTTKVCTKFPFLLKFPLREYQHIGLDWLVTMYEKRLNGILADEMGLGKTIMTIALLAHLACEKGIWGPHLIVVPTSVMLNWETEFLKWCPAFKILTYFGNAKERKNKRQGWLKPGSFHVCVTTYRLVIQDSKVFKRKKWKYLILDEAHLIKNWKSQRWQTLLNFNSKRRILLTGTPLQNDLMELWSLMHFLMPHIFQSHQEFKDWFCNPISGMVEGQEKINKDVVDRLHNVLRPFILRRLKRDVEKQLPTKHEHVIYCRLSRRQRNLYEDFIASSETQATLTSGNFFGMISVIMQLRKVCNHPDLFEGRPIVSSFDLPGIDMQLSSAACSVFSCEPFSNVDLRGLGIIFTHLDFCMSSWEINEVEQLLILPGSFRNMFLGTESKAHNHTGNLYQGTVHGTSVFAQIQRDLIEERIKQAKERADATEWWNSLWCQKKPVFGTNLRELVSIKHPTYDINELKNKPSCYMTYSSKLADIVLSPVERFFSTLVIVEHFMFAIPAARAPPPFCWCSKSDSSVFLHASFREECTHVFSPLLTPIRPAIVRKQIYFPDRCLIQFDCGKLQELANLLRRLKSGGHRALIFTQMTKMLDILEAFINLYGYTYMRLDGSTQPEERQTLMQRFNTNPKYFLFILSTRSGGVGINLVGADTVIFYDSDWNPAMDQQAQDRCHRIGQTREVHIYRLISECTIEENILKKANQKRALDDLVIQAGSYNTQFFKKLNPMELFSGHRTFPSADLKNGCAAAVEGLNDSIVLSNADVEAALKQAEDEADYMALKKVEQEEEVDNQEFTEEAIGRIDDDELVNDDDANISKPEMVISEHKCSASIASKENGLTLYVGNANEHKVLTFVEHDEEIDMLSDVKQMAAAAAAAGQASSSFENQLRPVDRYAMRFLDLWNPIIDKSGIENEIETEEEEWELDRIQKFKDEMEAEIDEDEEPFLYKKWDADLATEAYKQRVEALAQQQLEELEYEAQERLVADDGIADTARVEKHVERKSKSKKSKKKFKSLKKGSLTSEKELMGDDEVERESDMDIDDYIIYSPEDTHSNLLQHVDTKKRKLDLMDGVSKTLSKKTKKASENSIAVESDASDKQHVENDDYRYMESIPDFERSASRSRAGSKLSITVMPLKRVMIIKREKFKKGNIWSKDCVPSPDVWTSQEDAILCAIVHEYGTNWSLVSDVLYGMTTGGFYRGRFRHPVHCCDRFRELFFKYILSNSKGPNMDKISAYTSGKALLKATEDHVHMLLNLSSELPDTELLLQKHFTALLSSYWLSNHNSKNWQSISSKDGLTSKKMTPVQNKPQNLMDRMQGKASRLSRIVAMALAEADATEVRQDEEQTACSQLDILHEADRMEIILEFPNDLVDSPFSFPPVITIPVCSSYKFESSFGHQTEDSSKSYCYSAEQHFRQAWESCLEGETSGWTSATFPTGVTARSRSGSRVPPSGRHKTSADSSKTQKSKVARNIDADDISLLTKPSPRMLEPIFSDLAKLDSPLISDASADLDYQFPPFADLPCLSMADVCIEGRGFSADLQLETTCFDMDWMDNIT